jgi:hypothetical protein
MLSKCANPDCSTVFRYLHEGKLYVIPSTTAPSVRRPSPDLKYAGKSRTLEYVWLCSLCCRDMTIEAYDGGAIRVVRKREIQNGSEVDISAASAIEKKLIDRASPRRPKSSAFALRSEHPHLITQSSSNWASMVAPVTPNHPLLCPPDLTDRTVARSVSPAFR